MTPDRKSTLPAGGGPATEAARQAHTGFIDDTQMEMIIGRLLQVGVMLAALVVLAGGILYLFDHAGMRANYRVFTPHPVLLRHPAALLKGIAHGDASAIVRLGILLLVATPICRVIFAMVAFAMERDRLYVAISATVLAVLLIGMLQGS